MVNNKLPKHILVYHTIYNLEIKSKIEKLINNHQKIAQNKM